MVEANAIDAARAHAGVLPRPLGFVPTMGALHDGHLRLVQKAKESCRSVVVSLFVNPTQFGPQEDYEKYPRDLAADRVKLESSGADMLFAPGTDEMYPPGFSTSVDVGEIGARYEGAIRPAHFRGVATVVTKLLNVIEPDILFAGQKDAQQTAVLAKLLRDLAFAARLEIVETVREPDGLALSSRNAYLTEKERAAAPSLHAALQAMLHELQSGHGAAHAREQAAAVLRVPGELEYLDAVDERTFEPLETLRAPAFVIGAARFGKTRLIDNLWVRA